ncbi:MAG: hypothetical protein KJZ93_24460 [Caldilineaceae bacterium]|nr:hypothetical protein [Caldilineaceae bacterium]
MLVKRKLTDEDRKALKQIRTLLKRYPGQYGRLDDPMVRQFAQDLLHYPPSEAIVKAEEFRERVKNINNSLEDEAEKAANRREELKKNPVYSLGRAGLAGIMLRSFMSSVNGTPLSSPNWYELNERGLVVHTPFSIVTERVVTHRDLQEKRFELGVNPPVYFDSILGFLKQLRINASAPWGQITLREPGSGVTLAEVVEIRPEQQLAKIKKDLALLYRAANPYANHLMLPKMVDFFSYYIDEWDDELQFSALSEETEEAETTSS